MGVDGRLGNGEAIKIDPVDRFRPNGDHFAYRRAEPREVGAVVGLKPTLRLLKMETRRSSLSMGNQIRVYLLT